MDLVQQYILNNIKINNMKEIQPINIWINGEQKIGEYLTVFCVFDNYESQATNQWQINAKMQDENGNDIKGELLASGNLSIFGQDYIDWGNQPAISINEWIYNWSASKLNLIII
jgi:hypothetical protein